MLLQVPDAIRRSSRLMVLRNPMSVDVLVYRKQILRDEDADADNQSTLGGMMMLANEDEADYTLEPIGGGKMQFLGRIAGSEYAVNGLDYGENDAVCYIEPEIENAFTVKKEDRVFWVMDGIIKAFQVLNVISPIQMPESRLAVYHIQPLEQPFEYEADAV